MFHVEHMSDNLSTRIMTHRHTTSPAIRLKSFGLHLDEAEQVAKTIPGCDQTIYITTRHRKVMMMFHVEHHGSEKIELNNGW